MLIIANTMRKLSFGKLMAVYEQTNLETGLRRWSELPAPRQLALAEEAFYLYLSDSFFQTPGALYLIWEERGDYRSALRLEPFRDGWLLAGLETHPDFRRRGYAAVLIDAALQYLESTGASAVYSHVAKNNPASLAVHIRCGFQKERVGSTYIDGSADTRSFTLKYIFPR